MAGLHLLPCALPAALIGGKARGLSELMGWGLDVPPALVIDAPSLAPALAGEALPDALREELRRALPQLGPGPWAVRSSGVSEDSEGSSFAGVYETVLGVQDEAGVFSAILRCCASATSPRARQYRAERSIPDEGLAVVVQRQVQPQLAGVIFTCDPVHADPARLVLEATPGLGEALVSGHVAPGSATLNRALNVTHLDATRCEGLTAALAQRVGQAALGIEARVGRPVDVEWAVQGDRLWILQWRPVTTRVRSATGQRKVWTNTNAAELLPDVARPLVSDLILYYVEDLLGPVVRPYGVTVASLGIFGQVSGRIYFNLNALLAWMRALPLLRGQDLSAFAAGLGGDRQAMAEALALLRPEDLPRVSFSGWRLVRGSAAIMWEMTRHFNADVPAALAQVTAENRRLAQVDPPQLTDAALMEHLRALRHNAVGERGAEILFCGAWGLTGFALLPKLTQRWLGDTDGSLAQRLLQGVGGLDSAAAGLALGALGERARDAGLADQLAGPWQEVQARLSATEPGRDFLAALGRFMEEHGHHARGETDLSIPRWREEPEYILRLIRAAAAGQTRMASGEVERNQARERLVEQTLARLSPWRAAVIRALLTRAIAGLAARENQRSEAMRRMATLRAALLELGQRLASRRVLQSQAEIWFLYWSEIERAVAGSTEGLRGLIDERTRQHLRWEAQRPPAVVVEGVEMPPRPLPPPSECALLGIAASPGVAEGRARVILHSDSAGGLEPGEILVAPHTDPGWTPYFLQAVAVVTNFGGMLSHGAVVAREYGLPAVVNVLGATDRIQTGQLLRVDGDRGVIEILDPPLTAAGGREDRSPGAAPDRG